MNGQNQRMSAGTYLIKCNNHVYAGSSSDFRRRKADHKSMLRAGKHPNKAIQDAFNEHGDMEFQLRTIMLRKQGESDTDYRDRLRAEEQVLIDSLIRNDIGIILCNKSLNARGPNQRDDMKAKWEDPAFRAKMLEFRKGYVASEETRAKMAKAKTGSRNPTARAVIVTNPDGTDTEFSCVSDAAKFFKTSQQMMDRWMKGATPWPGRGEYTRFKNEWISRYSARFKVG